MYASKNDGKFLIFMSDSEIEQIVDQLDVRGRFFDINTHFVGTFSLTATLGRYARETLVHLGYEQIAMLALKGAVSGEDRGTKYRIVRIPAQNDALQIHCTDIARLINTDRPYD